eukprot:scaffold20031_cov28-Prasinocladus_malaysianus.AAC.3
MQSTSKSYRYEYHGTVRVRYRQLRVPVRYRAVRFAILGRIRTFTRTGLRDTGTTALTPPPLCLPLPGKPPAKI